MAKQNKNVAVVHPAGIFKLGQFEQDKRKEEFQNLGFEVTHIVPQLLSFDGCTVAPILERATQLSYALTMRKFSIIFAARGGVGCTELIPFLENMLPPVISDKVFVGFSDVSFLGVYLAIRFPNLTYIHGYNFFSKNFFSGNKLDQNTLLQILDGKKIVHDFPVAVVYPELYSTPTDGIINSFVGKCVPLNLSLAESLSACFFISLPENNIIFLEECNEYVYRIIRKIDALINSNLLQNTKFIVLGSFTNCLDNNDQPVTRSFLLKLFAQKTKIPVIDFPMFGHDEFCFPLVMNSEVTVKLGQKSNLKFDFEILKSKSIATKFSSFLYRAADAKKVHFTGIGGTGMAQVAGFFVESGFKVTGSDNPIYPPMDKLISDLNIKPDVGFHAENIKKNKPDFIVLANVVSRLSASLQKNEELEEILNQNIPVLSFPVALKKYFLHSSRNIIISGTHGKTSTSSLVSFLLHSLKFNPSFLIGGSPGNFKAGFALHSKDLFVLEGDEYDSAFFDKGPKFLHYEPKISLINNIEFDHADIYENIEAIEAEFLKLAQLTRDRGGFVVANLDDPRVLKIANEVLNSGCKIIGFSNQNKSNEFPYWKLLNFKTNSGGSEVTIRSPQNKTYTFQTKTFGAHNALNCVASLAVLHANQLLEGGNEYLFLEKALEYMKDFRGVKRRFELLCEKNNIAVFDDFAHHPTAIASTIDAFKNYMLCANKDGKLIICFDPRNATMRRNILQKELIKSFAQCDLLCLGKIPKDLRMNPEDVLDGMAVVQGCGEKAKCFDDNQLILDFLKGVVKSGDTVVFMSSGSFDGIAHKFASIF